MYACMYTWLCVCLWCYFNMHTDTGLLFAQANQRTQLNLGRPKPDSSAGTVFVVTIEAVGNTKPPASDQSPILSDLIQYNPF